MGAANFVAKAMPDSWAKAVRPKWHLAQMVRRLQRQGGKITWDRELKCWTATKVVGCKTMNMPIGSFRELRRIVTFDRVERDNIFPWLESMADCRMFYDFGPSSGLESLTVNAHHGSEAVLVEPYAPSMVSILRGLVLAARNGYKWDRLHPVNAGGDGASGFGRVLLHGLPVFGGTHTSFQYAEDYGRGGRADLEIYAHQWAPSVSIDSLHSEFGFSPPTHVKIDVDGFERRIMEGATETLKAGLVHSYGIEVDAEHMEWMEKILADHSYVIVDKFEHYPHIADCWDCIFVREDLVAEFRPRLEAAKERLGRRIANERH